MGQYYCFTPLSLFCSAATVWPDHSIVVSWGRQVFIILLISSGVRLSWSYIDPRFIISIDSLILLTWRTAWCLHLIFLLICAFTRIYCDRLLTCSDSSFLFYSYRIPMLTNLCLRIWGQIGMTLSWLLTLELRRCFS